MAVSEGLFQSMHHQKATRNLSLGGLRLTALFPVGNGRVADRLVKQAAKRSQALEPNFETHVCNLQVPGAQKFLGLFNAALHQILMRSFVKCLTEKS